MARTAALLALLLACLGLPGTAAAVPQGQGQGGGAPAPRASLPDIEDEVMCVECGTALNISEAPSADRQRAFIRRRIAEGRSKAEIKRALVAEYGDSVLGTPSGRGFNVANWLVPLVLALVAVVALAATARRWRRAGALGRRTGGSDDDDEVHVRGIDPQDARRLERDMAGYDL